MTMDEKVLKGVRGCLTVLVVLFVVGVAYLAGYSGGNRTANAYRIERAETSPPVETPQVEPTPSPSPPSTAAAPRPTPANWDLYQEVWELIELKFYGKLPTEEERLDGAIRGALDTLDDEHTGYIPADLAEVMRSDLSGSLEGIGAVVQTNEAGQLIIARPMPGQPADLAGIKAGDIVLAANGRSLEGLGLYEAISLIRGPAGTTVTLTILRSGEPNPLEIQVVRARIPLPTVESEMLEGNVGYIRLYEFNGQATSRLRQALRTLLAQRPVGLILDLRDNPGGYLNEAVSIADEFLPTGIVLYERGAGTEEQVFESTDRGLADEIRLVVLINGGSASASEIVAGAIQDRQRGVLVGETSFGKDSVQEAHRLSNGAELRITIARWFTPNEQPIGKMGLEPDVHVPYVEDDREEGTDPQLERARLLILTGE
jgi:carboxyl-terminal processing protease